MMIVVSLSELGSISGPLKEIVMPKVIGEVIIFSAMMDHFSTEMINVKD